MTRFRWGSATDVGQVRQNNQDAVLASDSLFLVADGMGGHRGGEVASAVAIEAIEASYRPGVSVDELAAAVQHANEAVVARADDEPELRGMGTTLTGMALVVGDDEERLGIVNVGDSRLYLLKGGDEEQDLVQITDDHSLVATLVRQGQLTSEEAEDHPHRNILTRALGIDQEVIVDTWELLPFAGDRYLLCSDGLFNEVTEDEITRVLREAEDPAEAANTLVAMANDGGGRDNITVLVVDVVDDDGRAAEAAEAIAAGQVEPTETERVAKASGTSEPVLVPPASGKPEDGADGTPEATAATADAGGAGRPADPTAPGSVGPEPTRSRMTWRVVAFVTAAAVIVMIAALSVVTMANNTYYVGLDGEQVVVYRGRPGGLLWMQPTVEQRTALRRDEVPAQFRADIEAGKDQPSLEQALAYVANLEEVAAAAEAESLGAAIGGRMPGSTTTTEASDAGADAADRRDQPGDPAP